MSGVDDATDESLSARRTVTLALAVRFVDGFTGRPPDGPPSRQPRVSIQEFDAEPTVTADGYVVFREVPPGTPRLVVDGRGRFLDREHTVTATTLAADPPVASVSLTPTPAYAFPPGTTLVYGLVHDADDAAVTGASVTVTDTAVETETTRTGEFVLYFTDSDEWEVVEVDDVPRIRVAGQDPEVVVSHPDVGTGQTRLDVRSAQAATAVLELGASTLSVDELRFR